MLPQELDEYIETRVEELLNHNFRPAEIAKTLRLSRENVFNYIALIVNRRKEKLEDQNEKYTAMLKANHISASTDLKKIAWIEMQAARQAAYALIPPKDSEGNPVPNTPPMDIEEYCRLQMTAIRWGLIAHRCEHYESKVDGSLLESEGSTIMKFPHDLLKTHDLHMKLIARMPKEKVKLMAEAFRQARVDLDSVDKAGASSVSVPKLPAHGGNGNGKSNGGGNGNGHGHQS